ncbi:MAG: peptidyl-prolyl cis-trans isomerase [Panacagrimonas sp.]
MAVRRRAATRGAFVRWSLRPRRNVPFTMSLTVPETLSRAAAASPAGSLPRWLREPLLHFIVLGALLFAIDHVLSARRDDPNTIVIGREVVAEARALFRESRGREPDARELEALNRRWIDNEILYREGLALGVDRGDKMIRDRVIFKSLMVIETGLKLPSVDDTGLREWFEWRRARYDEPARYDFEEAVLAGDHSEATVRAFVTALNTGVQGDSRAGLRVFKGRPQDNLVQSYGEEFARALATSTPGEWRAMPTREGPRAVRLNIVTPPGPASFEALRNVVLADWTDATMAEQRTAAVRQRGEKYRIEFEDGAP